MAEASARQLCLLSVIGDEMAVKSMQVSNLSNKSRIKWVVLDLKEEYRSYLYINLRFFKHESLVKYQPGAKNS